MMVEKPNRPSLKNVHLPNSTPQQEMELAQGMGFFMASATIMALMMLRGATRESTKDAISLLAIST